MRYGKVPRLIGRRNPAHDRNLQPGGKSAERVLLGHDQTRCVCSAEGKPGATLRLNAGPSDPDRALSPPPSADPLQAFLESRPVGDIETRRTSHLLDVRRIECFDRLR